MKLQGVSVIFVLGVTGFVGTAEGLCLVRNTTRPNKYWYQCFRSNDYLADLNKSPIDIFGLTITNSKIQVVKNRSFSRLDKSLEILAILHCDIEEIEDNAFRGLKLMVIVLIGNKLEIIKSSWFEGLSNLKVVSLKDNRIKHIDENFFSILPPLDSLDISNNQLTCLPTASFGNFNVSKLHFRHNPLTWACQVLINDWLKDRDIREDYFVPSNMDPPYDLAKICVTRLPRPDRLDEEFLNTCIEETTRELLPPEGDYTIKQVCEFLKGKPSPFLDCTK